MTKLFKLATFTGRFQPIHKGHQYIIETALSLSDKVVVMIALPNIYRTKSNPLTYSERKDLIMCCNWEAINNMELHIIPFQEQVCDVSDWCGIMRNKIKDSYGEYPDAIFQGADKRNINYFKDYGNEFANMAEITIPRNIPNGNDSFISPSGTESRGFIVQDQYEKWCELVPKEIHHMYPFLKNIMKECK